MGEDTGREERKTYNYKSVSDIFQITGSFFFSPKYKQNDSYTLMLVNPDVESRCDFISFLLHYLPTTPHPTLPPTHIAKVKCFSA